MLSSAGMSKELSGLYCANAASNAPTSRINEKNAIKKHKTLAVIKICSSKFVAMGGLGVSTPAVNSTGVKTEHIKN